MYDSVNLRSPSPDVDVVSNFPYTSSNLRANRQPKIGRGLPSIDDGRKAGEANRTTQKKRWKEYPEECPAEINSMSEEEVYDGIRNCTFLDTEIPGESREGFVGRLKKERAKKINKKISEKTKR